MVTTGVYRGGSMEDMAVFFIVSSLAPALARCIILSRTNNPLF